MVDSTKAQESNRPARVPYSTPSLRLLGTFQALTQTRTCATNFNDGTAAGCNMSFKKS